MSTDAEEYRDQQVQYEARVAFEKDGYGVPYTPAIRKAYEEHVRAARALLAADAVRVRALAAEFHTRDRSRATGGPITGPLRDGSAGQIFVGAFPPLQNPSLRTV